MSEDRTVFHKRQAAEAAVALVELGMAVGLGTGSTAAFAVAALGARVAAGLSVRAIPTSEATAQAARRAGIPLADFATLERLDLTIDGADAVLPGALHLVKGLGGALLREKIVAAASARMVVIADASKLVSGLGGQGAVPVPVEVVAFGWQATAARLESLGLAARLRRDAQGAPFVSDGGNLILDCAAPAMADPAAWAARIKAETGVIETGLFIGLASEAMIAGPDGLRRLVRG
ncbi:MAG: ribose-5-phosphate isomerase RpiA [Rhodospirillales bacterium]|nr:ribose-5-phosphate isomerase RpiA [Rhodospirillales bacterium]